MALTMRCVLLHNTVAEEVMEIQGDMVGAGGK